ncbi:DUF1254 domain-containing protein [Tunturibacter psychrotolerans]|uniref:DUF1254 domain-containing protein n=1 Tax=Tunturiibacter psychrotolerans TaxID=3069686 RepID=A0AAU7ZP32_9BACT
MSLAVTRTSFLAGLAMCILLTVGCETTKKPAEPGLSLSEAQSIAKEAYIYGVPMVAQYKTMYAYSIDKGGHQYMGPFDSILNIARVFTPADTAFVTPNSDTPYSFAGLDLRAAPAVITVPKMEKNRYFVFQLMDLYTFNFAYIGSRTTGNNGGIYLIAGPEWKGEAPKNITKTFTAETEFISVVGRTQLFNPADLVNVKKIQSQYKIQPLHEFLKTAAPPAAQARLAKAHHSCRAFAHKYFPKGDAIGHSIQMVVLKTPPTSVTCAPGADGWIQIVGVIDDKLDDGLCNRIIPEIFVPFTMAMWNYTQFLIRTDGAPTALIHTIGQQVASVEREQQIGA